MRNLANRSNVDTARARRYDFRHDSSLCVFSSARYKQARLLRLLPSFISFFRRALASFVPPIETGARRWRGASKHSDKIPSCG